MILILDHDGLLESPSRLGRFNCDWKHAVRIIALKPTLEGDRIGHGEERDAIRSVQLYTCSTRRVGGHHVVYARTRMSNSINIS